MHFTTDKFLIKLRKPTQHSGTKQGASVSSTANSRVVKTGRMPPRRHVPKTQVHLGFLEEVDDLGHALETWSDTAAQYWVRVGRKSQTPLAGKFATFRMKLVLGETNMPLDCVIWRVEEMLS